MESAPSGNGTTLPEKRKFRQPRAEQQPSKKGRFDNKKQQKQAKKAKAKAKEGGTEEVLGIDIKNFLASHNDAEAVVENAELPEEFSEIELEVEELSSTGDGLALHGGRAYVVPFSIPGDRVKVKVIRHQETHSVVDFLSVVRPSPDRDDSLIGCKYFGSCSGCQLQMLSYDKQLAHKKRVVEKAYEHFADLPEGILPPIGDTIGSPLQYNYRTKLTPHFDGPRKGGFQGDQKPEIGFNLKGQRRVLDIEDCPIGVDSVREGFTTSRADVLNNLGKYKRGATLLLRESTKRIPDSEDLSTFTEKKLCITDPKATTTEYVDNFKFDSPAGAFFQNNNSILPTFTAYIRDNLSLPVSSQAESNTEPPKYLVDAYCGSGLFTVTCGSAVQKAIGVDISPDSIAYATRNAKENGITNATFIAGTAEKIFGDIDFPGSKASCIIDPPRKGCDELFLEQLMVFKPKRIVYVSCNVHTQARDLEYILKHETGQKYKVDSIRGFDFFPQTHHVESVAVLTLAD
ncbi:S-adenosyl-L-methionine-dependent methyltransferase [Sphaerosporella brunnea]|uniref:tRNA (uracil(54)-C(5))-methyltransferase n=1 Tax=Sphaerosporella brunnea TaxID=1250544 RepID=A0A5J5EP49_9PEZI|nr:S-adenosyl-L-methionine-dependent methyltransferase [Sphaerosporella brunnea]